MPFNLQTVTTMRTALDAVCLHIPPNSTAVRVFVASRILECATGGEETYDGFLTAGRRAVTDQFGNVDAFR